MQKLAAVSALSLATALATALVLSGCVGLGGETDLAAPPAESPSPALSIVVSTTVPVSYTHLTLPTTPYV